MILMGFLQLSIFCDSLENHYWIAPVLQGPELFTKAFYTTTGSHMSEWKTLDCAWTSLYHYCLSKRMKGRKIQDTWRDEGKQSSSVPALQIPYLTSPYWATSVLQSLLPSPKSQGAVSLLPQKSLPSAETGSCTKGLHFQEILLIPWFCRWQPGHCQWCIPSSLFLSLSGERRVFPSSETSQILCKS